MTDQTPINVAQSGAAEAAIPESSVGRLLQRGGEELLLEKVADRFAVRISNWEALSALMQQVGGQVSDRRLPGQLSEIELVPERRDEAMQQIRASGAVDYVTHVYRLQNVPDSFIYLTNEITIQFAVQVSSDQISQIAGEMGLRPVKPLEGVPNAFVFEVTLAATENPLKIANRLIQRSQVLTAEPNVAVQTQQLYRPRDPIYPRQWHLNHNGGAELAPNSHIFAEKAWDITRGLRSVVVAIMDDSIDINHPDFQAPGKIVAPRDFKENDFLPLPGEPEDNHGTACAGVAVAEENGAGAVGVAPGCALMPIRTTGFLDDQSIEELFDWAMQKGASVISCSWGPAGVRFPLPLRQRAALTSAATKGRNGKGCVIVFAAGNSNRPTNGSVNEKGWPNNIIQGQTQWIGGFTSHPDVITVSASTSLNKKAVYSNWGAEVSVCAPSNNAPPGVGLPEAGGYVFTPPEIRSPIRGLGVVTTDRLGTEGYDRGDFTADFGGTSSACPVVAGVAALVLSVNPDLTAAEVKQILQQTADKIVDNDPDPQLGLRKGTYEAGGRCDWFGYGKVNAFRAVQMAMQRQVAAAIGANRKIQLQNTTSLDIPDADPRGAVSPIQVSESASIRDIQVTVVIEHSYAGDLEVSLVAPTGQTILLQSRTTGRRNGLQATYTPQTTPLLRRLLNQPSQGRWQLRVVDQAQGDTGALKIWQLTLGI
jgi:subtilisin family serine protease/subtilisin-like proprotein convertase family protein